MRNRFELVRTGPTITPAPTFCAACLAYTVQPPDRVCQRCALAIANRVGAEHGFSVMFQAAGAIALLALIFWAVLVIAENFK